MTPCKRRRRVRQCGTLAAWLLTGPASALAQPCSTGADGALLVSGGIVTLNLPADGVFNYTTITVNAGGTLRFNRNAANTPAFLLATGAVLVNGAIQANGVNRIGAVGGGDGGLHGHGLQAGTDGTGPAPGFGGAAGNPRPGNAGGGAGMATHGTSAIRHTGPVPAPGGAATQFPVPLSGGSGGGGGGGWEFFTNLFDGGDGGGAGGAIYICSDSSITLNGSIVANGSNGGTAFANIGGNGGPGGGGSGGVIDLRGASVTLASGSLVQAMGGVGGGISTLPVFDPNFSSGANGGKGYVRIAGPVLTLAGTIDAVLICGDTCPGGLCGDLNGDGLHNGYDIAGFTQCLLTGAVCDCADFDCDRIVAPPDIAGFVNCLLD